MYHRHNGYLDKYVVVLHQQGAAVNLSQELSRHHFVRAVLDETGDVQVTCRRTQTEDTFRFLLYFLVFHETNVPVLSLLIPFVSIFHCNTFI